MDRNRTLGAPNIIACGIGQADPKAILRVATQQALDEPGEPIGELIRRSVSYVAG